MPATDVQLRVLLVEDDSSARRIAQELLSDMEGLEPSLTSVSTYEEALEAVGNEPYDVILTAHDLKGRAGLGLLDERSVRATGTPLIVLTHGGREVDLEASRAGAAGYLKKGEVTAPDLERSIRFAVAQARRARPGPGAEAGDLTELKETTERAHLQARLLEAVGQAVIATALDGTVTYWNRAAAELYGWSSEEAAGKVLSRLIPSELETGRAEEVFALQRRGRAWSGEFEMRRKNGEIFPALVTNAPIRDEEGEIIGVVGVSSDLSGRKKLEVELRQAQRMEAIGRLAGGVAHDFNNLLTVIQLHTQLLLAGPGRDALVAPDLLEIQVASRRAAELTRQLLAFGRKQVFEEQVVDLREEVDGMGAMLRRMAPSNVTLDIEVSSRPAMVRADRVQIQQVLLNLVVNSIDALSDRENEPGSIEIRVDHTRLSERDVAKIPWAVKPIDYARLTVRDNGAGMSDEVLEHLFEPFYTTRDARVGLGLASVYGIVKQSGGHLFVESGEGSGTAFRILLPVVATQEKAPEAGGDPRPAKADGEARTVLVVEDDRSVRNVAVRVLSSGGYDVLTAPHGKDALIIAGDEAVRIDLVVTDIVMPELGGVELARELKRLRPDLPIVLMSGYPREESGVDLAELGVSFLSKPFTVAELLEAVSEALRS